MGAALGLKSHCHFLIHKIGSIRLSHESVLESSGIKEREVLHMVPTRTDPELIRQLNEAALGTKPVEAVFMLRSEDPKIFVVNPNHTEEVTHQVLERVKDEVGVDAEKINIFPNFGSFVVAAPARFVRRLIEQPEIASATANRSTKSDPESSREKKSASKSSSRKPKGNTKRSK